MEHPTSGDEGPADAPVGGRRDNRRHLRTPAPSSSRRQRDISCHSSTRSRSRIRSLREKELEVELEQELVWEREKSTKARRGSSRPRRSGSRTKRRQGSCSPSKVKRRRNSREHSNEDTRDIGAARDKRSRTPTFTIKDVMDLMYSVKGGFASQPTTSAAVSKSIDHKNILPQFDPSAKNQRIDIWLPKVNECATVYGWDDKTTIHFAMQKLQGLAKVWYEDLNSIMQTWEEWQGKLMSAFPCEQNYGQILEDMLKRKSRQSEPIEVYYYEKLALLTQCDITGKRAVDCIIHGISDRTMKSSSLALCCSQPDQLLRFLMSNKEYQYPDRSLSR